MTGNTAGERERERVREREREREVWEERARNTTERETAWVI
jgi:hypothetical protein